MDIRPVFKFATVRNASDEVSTPPENIISPSSTLVERLIAVNESSASSSAKLADFNERLDDFLASSDFIRSKSQFTASLADTGTTPYYERLFDNIVARTITRSNTNQVFKLLVKQIKAEHLAANIGSYPDMTIEALKIVLPDGLLYSFLGSNPSTSGTAEAAPDFSTELAQYASLTEAQEMLRQARAERVIQFLSRSEVVVADPRYAIVNEVLGSRSLTVTEAERIVGTELTRVRGTDLNVESNRLMHQQMNQLQRVINEAKADGLTSFQSTRTVTNPKFDAILETIGTDSATLEEAERIVSQRLQLLSLQLLPNAPVQRHAMIGDNWVPIGDSFIGENIAPEIGDNAIMVYSNGCWLKFPFQIADLRVVEQQTVGYLPGEIAHIHNTQPGESLTRVTRRLKRTEDAETLLTEEEVTKETDNQSTEKFAFEREAAQVQQEENSWNVNASVSATYGPISASVDGGYESSNSSTNSNSASQTYAKETVQKVVERISNKIRRERTTKTIEEFEETVTHMIDNKANPKPQSVVYRWLNKLSRATLKNYGKRLVFQIDVAHPSHYYIARSIDERPNVVLPQDPRKFRFENVTIDHPTKVTRENYLALCDIYKTRVDAPPAESVILNKAFANQGATRKVEEVEIPKGYGVVKGKFNGTTWDNNLMMTIASSAVAAHYWSTPDTLFRWINGGIGANEFSFSSYPNGILITDKVAITFFGDDYTLNFELECRLTEDAYRAWQVKAFQAILDGYEALKEQAESDMSAFNPNLPGLNPQKKYQLIRDELKKESLRKMFRCNPIGIADKYVVGKEYHSDCCKDGSNAEKVRFLESVFDWKNMTYELYPYYYGSRDVKNLMGQKVSDNWNEIQKFTDGDPHFEAFLQASYATVRIPVHRDAAKELAAINFMMNNSIANYEVVPEGALPLLEELASSVPTLFSYDLNGEEIADPVEVVDLGVFNLPTDLVILECGVQDGVKPIGFPTEQGPVMPDISIPKNYSPAIIADTCPS